MHYIGYSRMLRHKIYFTTCFVCVRACTHESLYCFILNPVHTVKFEEIFLSILSMCSCCTPPSRTSSV